MTDPWTCRWCGDRFVVPSLTGEHEEKCPARPARAEDAK